MLYAGVTPLYFYWSLISVLRVTAPSQVFSLFSRHSTSLAVHTVPGILLLVVSEHVDHPGPLSLHQPLHSVILGHQVILAWHHSDSHSSPSHTEILHLTNPGVRYFRSLDPLTCGSTIIAQKSKHYIKFSYFLEWRKKSVRINSFLDMCICVCSIIQIITDIII